LVRVKREIEELVGRIARKHGYMEFTVRNTAILYGLMVIAMAKARIPASDREFEELLEKVRGVVGE